MNRMQISALTAHRNLGVDGSLTTSEVSVERMPVGTSVWWTGVNSVAIQSRDMEFRLCTPPSKCWGLAESTPSPLVLCNESSYTSL